MDHIVLPENATLFDALRGLEACGKNVQCIIDGEERMVGLVTDGDIRRGLLSGLGLEACVSEVLTGSFQYVTENVDRDTVQDMMKALEIKQVPVLDKESRLMGIHFMGDFFRNGELPHVAVIMAGGKGQRLKPLTENNPKPMLKVAGRPILERLVLKLAGNGIKRIYISINYLGWMIREYFGDGSRLGCTIKYLEEEQELGTGGSLGLLPKGLNEPILVLNGDLVTGANFGDILDFHNRNDSEATIVAKHYRHRVPYGTLTFDKDRLVAMREKPDMTCFINTGIYVLNPCLLELVDHATSFPITRIFELCLEAGRPVSVYHLEDEWRDLGDIKQFYTACGKDIL